MSFGEWLHEWRTKRGLSQEGLAKAANNACTGAYISSLERGQYKGKNGEASKPSVEIVDALAAALNAPRSEARIAAGYAPGTESFGSVAAKRAAEYVEGMQKQKREDALAFLEFWRQRYPAIVASSTTKPDEGEPEEVDKPNGDVTMTDPARGSESNGKEKTGTSDKRGASKKRAGRHKR